MGGCCELLLMVVLFCCFFLRRRRKKTPRTTAARRATPPITPPAIAPTGVDFLDLLELLDSLELLESFESSLPEEGVRSSGASEGRLEAVRESGVKDREIGAFEDEPVLGEVDESWKCVVSQCFIKVRERLHTLVWGGHQDSSSRFRLSIAPIVGQW